MGGMAGFAKWKLRVRGGRVGFGGGLREGARGLRLRDGQRRRGESAESQEGEFGAEVSVFLSIAWVQLHSVRFLSSPYCNVPTKPSSHTGFVLHLMLPLSQPLGQI